MAAHPASNTTQGHRAWSPSVPADIPQETTQGLWRVDDHLPARQAGTDSERQHLKGAFAPVIQQVGQQVGKAFVQPSQFLSHPGSFFPSREPHLMGILVPEETFSQRPVEALHDSLVPVNIDPTTADLDPVFRQHLADRAHELSPRVNLEKLGPLQ